MKITIDKELCINCGLCEQQVPDVFEFVDNVTRVKVDVVPPDKEADVREAISSCPTEAIKIVEE